MNQKELIKKINKFCDHFDDAYALNCGGCCYVAAVIAEMLEFKNIKYKVRYYDCPTHYVIEVNRTPLNLGSFVIMIIQKNGTLLIYIKNIIVDGGIIHILLN